MTLKRTFLILPILLFWTLSLYSQINPQKKQLARKPRLITNLPALKSLKPSNVNPATISTTVENANPVVTTSNTNFIGQLNTLSKTAVISKDKSVGEIDISENGTVRWWEGSLGKITVKFDKNSTNSIQSNSPVVKEVLSFLQNNKSILGLKNPLEELQLMNAGIDELGYQHIRFQQVFRGLKVWARDLYVHINERGEIYSINGIYEPTPFSATAKPLVSDKFSIDKVVNGIKSDGKWNPVSEEQAKQLGIEDTKAELVFYKHTDNRLYLAYAVKVSPSLTESWMYFVDARSGKSIDRIALHRPL